MRQEQNAAPGEAEIIRKHQVRLIVIAPNIDSQLTLLLMSKLLP